MKILKLIIFLAVVLAVYVGAWFAFTSGEVDPGAEPVLTDISARERGEVERYVNRFNNGWNDTAFQAAKRYLARGDHQSNRTQLQDLFYTRLIHKLDSVIVSQYTPDMSQRGLDEIFVLSDSYRGLDSVAANYAQGSLNARVVLLRDTRELYREVHGFSRAGYILNPQLRFNVAELENNRPIWSWRGSYRDYSSFMNSRKRQGAAFRARLAANELLRHVRWMNQELEERTITGRSQEERYMNEESQSLLRSLQSIPVTGTNPRLAEQLTRMKNDLPAWLLNRNGVREKLDEVISRLTPPEGAAE